MLEAKYIVHDKKKRNIKNILSCKISLHRFFETLLSISHNYQNIRPNCVHPNPYLQIIHDNCLIWCFIISEVGALLVKVKLKLSLWLNNYHPMKMYGEVEIKNSSILTSALDGGKRSASHPEGTTPGTHCRGVWMDPRTGLDTVEQTTISCPDGNQTPTVQPIACCYTELSRLHQLPSFPSHNYTTSTMYLTFRIHVSVKKYWSAVSRELTKLFYGADSFLRH
jgi:hypothetical protein